MTKELATIEERRDFLDRYDNFLFDCDGVLWEGTKLIPGVDKAMEELRKRGKKVYFVTNNSTKSRTSFLKKFQGFNMQAELHEIFSSAFATAAYLKQVLHFPADKKVYIIGMTGIQEELNAEGIRTCGGDEDVDAVFGDEPIPDDPEVGAVVIGLDLKVNYTKYAKAFTYLKRNPGCHFILTNGDTTFPTHGNLVPGAGSIAAPIMKALNREPDAILGKPAQNMLEAIFAEYNLQPCKTVMIGDRLDTDIDFGNQGGIETLCVLTGVTSKDEMLSPNNKIKPTFYIDSFADLVSA
ncbi:HAD-like domain-containing protein [Fennellomyces sp. T-0311]|nr:HAD-like domain-containing protein [Fennellomyces sp. T-0311]